MRTANKRDTKCTLRVITGRSQAGLGLMYESDPSACRFRVERLSEQRTIEHPPRARLRLIDSFAARVPSAGVPPVPMPTAPSSPLQMDLLTRPGDQEYHPDTGTL